MTARAATAAPSIESEANFCAFAVLSHCRRARAALRDDDREGARAAIFALVLHEPNIPGKGLRGRVERARLKAINELSEEFRALLTRAVT